MRFFGGYSMREIAEFLEITESAANQEWTMAQAWLHRELKATADGAQPDPSN
jgi:hypothetical protein